MIVNSYTNVTPSPTRYGFDGATKNPDFVVDVALDGDHYTIEMPESYGCTAVYLGFYSDPLGTHHAVPTAGVVEVRGSQIDDLYILPSTGDASIDTTTVGLSPTYHVPWFNGYVKRVQIRTVGIQGARYMRAFAWRS